MNTVIAPSKLAGTINAIPSKSHAHRALICAALCQSGDETVIDITSCGEDIDATMSVLKAIGVNFTQNGGLLTVEPPEKYTCGGVINCRESGSTLRFMLPVLAALGISGTVTGSGRLPDRPIGELLNELSSHGAVFSSPKLPTDIGGTLSGGEFRFDGGVSSQYITGLLLASVITGEECKIHIDGALQSKPYVDLTVKVMRDFGVDVYEDDGTYTVKKGSKYKSPGNYSVEGDYSNAAFWLCAGVGMRGLCEDSFQGDSKIIDILKSAGAKFRRENGVIYPDVSNLHGFEMNAENTPDIVPPLAVVAATANGKTVIYGAERLRIKESDRLATVYEMLKNLGADVTMTSDGFVINGKKTLSGGTVNSHNDHRIAMSAALASIKCRDKVIVNGADAVNKSYRDFWEDFKKLGGAIDEIR